MPLVDMFRPKWKHSDPSVRIGALEGLDQDLLSRIAVGDDEEIVRTAALARVTDQSLLAKVATTARRTSVRCAAVGRLTDQKALEGLAIDDTDIAVRTAAIARIRDPAVLIHLAVQDPEPPVRASAVERIDDSGTLAKIALDDADPAVRWAAADRVSDQAVLTRIAFGDPDQANRERAIGRIANEETLAEIALVKVEVGTDLFGEQFAMRASQEAALERLSDPELVGRVATLASDQFLVRAAIERLDDPSRLAALARDERWFAREAAIRKVGDAGVLLAVIREDADVDVRHAAVARLSEPALLAQLQAPPLRAALDDVGRILDAEAKDETDLTGRSRSITGSTPTAEKVAEQFHRLLGRLRA